MPGIGPRHVSVTDQPFGTFRPDAVIAGLTAALRALPANAVGKALATWGRKPLLAARRAPWDVDLGGRRWRLYPHDNAGERRFLFLPRQFDPLEFALMTAWLPPGGTFVDVGANAGFYTVHGAACVGPAGRVLAIEPGAIVRARLTDTLTLNDLHATVTIAPVAAGAAEGIAHLSEDARNLGASHLGEAGTEVPVKPLLNILSGAGLSRVDVLKIDIEGHEDQALIPFLQTAPAALLPHLMIIERSAPLAAQALPAALNTAGYRAVATTRMNVVYRKYPVQPRQGK